MWTRKEFRQLRDALWNDRTSFDSHWKELSDFLLPRRSRFFVSDRNRGDRRNANIIDSSPVFAARTLSSGLHAGLTSPARPWFKLSTPDAEMAEHQPIKIWLHTVTKRMEAVFQRTNLYQSMAMYYLDLGVFGTGAMGHLRDEPDLFRTYVYPVGSYACGMDARGRVASFTRDYLMTVRQVVDAFGRPRGASKTSRTIDWTNISQSVKSQWETNNREATVEVTWVVMPNDDADASKLLSIYKPWVSVYFEKNSDDETFLSRSGYDSFPVFVCRWDVTGEDTYATSCPGMIALGDIKGLQLEQREKAKGIQKQVNPPLKGSYELRNQKTSLLPGDITFLREPQHGLGPVHEVNWNLNDLTMDIREVQYRVRRAFFEDLFLMLTYTGQMGVQPPTAAEVAERHEEKLLALGPVLERTSDELLSPLIDRTYLLMEQSGLIPPPPDELQGVQLKVEYISILAQAQKLVGVSALDRMVMTIGQMANAFPEVRDKLDVYRIVDEYADALGVNPQIVRSTEDAHVIAGERAKQQQAMLQAEQAQKLAAAAHAAGNTPVGTGSALDALLGGAVAPSSLTPGAAPAPSPTGQPV